MSCRASDTQLPSDRDIAGAIEYGIRAECGEDVVGIHEIDDGATIVFVSPNIQELAGYSADQLKGRPFLELVCDADQSAVQAFMGGLKRSHHPQTISFRLRTRSGALAWVVTLARAAMDPLTGEYEEILTSTRLSPHDRGDDRANPHSTP